MLVDLKRLKQLDAAEAQLVRLYLVYELASPSSAMVLIFDRDAPRHAGYSIATSIPPTPEPCLLAGMIEFFRRAIAVPDAERHRLTLAIGNILVPGAVQFLPDRLIVSWRSDPYMRQAARKLCRWLEAADDRVAFVEPGSDWCESYFARPGFVPRPLWRKRLRRLRWTPLAISRACWLALRRMRLMATPTSAS